mgnify:CR=1 FL=1
MNEKESKEIRKLKGQLKREKTVRKAYERLMLMTSEGLRELAETITEGCDLDDDDDVQDFADAIGRQHLAEIDKLLKAFNKFLDKIEEESVLEEE